MMGLRSTHLIGNQRTLCSLPFDWCCCPHFALSFPGYQSSSQFCKCGGIRTHISWSSPGASSRLSHLLAPRWLIATPHCSSGSLVLPYSVQSTHSKLYNSSPLCVQVPGAESRIRTGACISILITSQVESTPVPSRHEAKIYKENPGEKPRQTFARWPRSSHHLSRGLMLTQTLFNVPKDEQLHPSALITALLPGWLDFEALQADNN